MALRLGQGEFMVDPEPLPTLTWRDALVYYLAVVGICTAGTFLAYGPLTSDAWSCWAGSSAWIRDTIRAVVFAALTLFALSALGVISPDQHQGKQGFRYLFPETRSGWITVAAIAVALAVFLILLGGRSFAATLPERCPSVDVTFEAVWVPYIPYFFYVLGFWIGILWPLLYCLILHIRRDWRWRAETLARFEANAPITRQRDSTQHKDKDAFTAEYEDLIVTHQAYVTGLKKIAERYFPILIVVILVLLYEQLTPSHETITELAVELSKVVVWVFAGPVLIVFVAMVALGYQRSVSRVEDRLAMFAEDIHVRGGMSSLLDRVMSARRDLLWSRSAGAFVMAVIKNTNIAMPLLLALTGYVINALSDGTWEEIFFPRALVDLVESWFQSPPTEEIGDPARLSPP